MACISSARGIAADCSGKSFSFPHPRNHTAPFSVVPKIALAKQRLRTGTEGAGQVFAIPNPAWELNDGPFYQSADSIEGL
jgi:hypothetical protein